MRQATRLPNQDTVALESCGSTPGSLRQPRDGPTFCWPLPPALAGMHRKSWDWGQYKALNEVLYPSSKQVFSKAAYVYFSRVLVPKTIPALFGHPSNGNLHKEATWAVYNNQSADILEMLNSLLHLACWGPCFP